MPRFQLTVRAADGFEDLVDIDAVDIQDATEQALAAGLQVVPSPRAPGLTTPQFEHLQRYRESPPALPRHSPNSHGWRLPYISLTLAGIMWSLGLAILIGTQVLMATDPTEWDTTSTMGTLAHAAARSHHRTTLLASISWMLAGSTLAVVSLLRHRLSR